MRRIGIVCSGGMSKGAYQIGAFRALSRYIAPEDVATVSAASVGALNAYAYFSGRLEDAADLWTGLNKEKASVSLYSVLKGKQLYDVIREVSVSPLKCRHFFAPLFDPANRETVYRDIAGIPQEQMNDYLNAIIAVMGFCKPYPLEGRHFYDGAAIDNIPVFPLQDQDLDYIICIYFDGYNYVFDTPEYDEKFIKINFDEAESFMLHSFRFEEARIRREIADGEDKARQVLDFAFADGMDRDAVRARIRKLNDMHPERHLRITGDMVLNNMNKVAQRLTRKSLVSGAETTPASPSGSPAVGEGSGT